MADFTDDERFQAYLQERRLLFEAEKDSAQGFDKVLVTLSAGALVLSANYFWVHPPNQDANLLIASWIILCVTLIFKICGLWFSQSTLTRQRQIIELFRRGESTLDEKNWSAVITRCFDVGSFITFILGLVFLTLFSITIVQNSQNKNNDSMSDQQNTPKQDTVNILSRKSFTIQDVPGGKPSQPAAGNMPAQPASPAPSVANGGTTTSPNNSTSSSSQDSGKKE